ncbi:MAG: hypothetical protein K2Q18_16740 [Bdellovibrionales bacterium]|nr:hypothetical protein [Bdellovibrionales bacterium]
MKMWNKLSIQARYYTISFLNLAIWWGLLTLLSIEFTNVVFFLTAFVWHFALLTPGLKEKVMTTHHKLSFLAVVVRVNHYLQMFINIKRLPYAPSFIRALSPALFTFILFVLGGSGNIVFTFLGSLTFEVVYLFTKEKSITPSVHTDDLDIPPAIPSAEKTHE